MKLKKTEFTNFTHNNMIKVRRNYLTNLKHIVALIIVSASCFSFYFSLFYH